MAEYMPGIRMVPRPIWNKNLRSILGKYQWQKLRNSLIDERGTRCQTCGAVVESRSRINAHEEWTYHVNEKEKTGVALLAGIKLSCWHCHAIEHFGRTAQLVRMGTLREQAIEDTIEHFCRINSVDRVAFEKHCVDARKEWERLNALSWEINWGSYQQAVEDASRKRELGRRKTDVDSDDDDIED